MWIKCPAVWEEICFHMAVIVIRERDDRNMVLMVWNRRRIYSVLKPLCVITFIVCTVIIVFQQQQQQQQESNVVGPVHTTLDQVQESRERIIPLSSSWNRENSNSEVPAVLLHEFPVEEGRSAKDHRQSIDAFRVVASASAAETSNSLNAFSSSSDDSRSQPLYGMLLIKHTKLTHIPLLPILPSIPQSLMTHDYATSSSRRQRITDPDSLFSPS